MVKTNIKDYRFSTKQSIFDIEHVGFKPQKNKKSLKIHLLNQNMKNFLIDNGIDKQKIDLMPNAR